MKTLVKLAALTGTLILLGGCGFFDPPVYNPNDPFGPFGPFGPLPPVYHGTNSTAVAK